MKEKDIQEMFINFKFTSKELDEETGLYYFGARYYDAQTSRWISPDPIYDGLKDGLSIYGYCKNNPLIYHDPTGLKKVDKKTTEWMPSKDSGKYSIKTMPYRTGDASKFSIELCEDNGVSLGEIKGTDPEAWEHISNLFIGMSDSSIEKVAKYIEAARTNYSYNSKISRTTITMADIVYAKKWDAARPSQLEQGLICLAM